MTRCHSMDDWHRWHVQGSPRGGSPLRTNPIALYEDCNPEADYRREHRRPERHVHEVRLRVIIAARHSERGARCLRFFTSTPLLAQAIEEVFAPVMISGHLSMITAHDVVFCGKMCFPACFLGFTSHDTF